MHKTFMGPNNSSFSYVGIRLRDEARQKLEQIAASEEVTLSHILRWAVREYLERHQWRENQKTYAPRTIDNQKNA